MKRYLGEKKVLRIYIDNSDTFNGEPLWQYIVQHAKKEGIAGATVFKGVAGIGAHSQLHTFEVWTLSQKLPVVIEIIDDEEKVNSFLEKYDEAIEEGLVTINSIEVLRYKHNKNIKNKN